MTTIPATPINDAHHGGLLFPQSLINAAISSAPLYRGVFFVYSHAMNINGMLGLGDNVYQRSFIPADRPVTLKTPWPQLYSDMPNVHCVPSSTSLRTQSKNEAASRELYAGKAIKRPGPSVNVSYASGRTIFDGMYDRFRTKASPLSLPDYGEPVVKGKYALVRPATVRKEWRADTRNCDPKYICEAAKALRDQGVKVVSVADLSVNAEWLVGDEPDADTQYHQGELSVEQLMALAKNAACIVGPIGWIVPVSMAYKTPAWIICGGQGGFNHPSRLTHPQWGPHNTTFAHPDKWCMCRDKQHNCTKEITGHDSRFREWLSDLVS